MNDAEQQKRADKARGLRYKKPMCQSMNIDGIREFIYNASEAATEVAWASSNDDVLIDAFNGDDDEAFEFRMAFDSLANDMDKFSEDLNSYGVVPDTFDDFFCGIGGDGARMLGYDTVEEDYFGLSGFEESLAILDAQKRLMRFSKTEIIAAAGKCLRVAAAYMALRSRYEDLQAALDIIRAQNGGLLEAIKKINDMYEAAEIGKDDWDTTQIRAFEDMCAALPEECWLR